MNKKEINFCPLGGSGEIGGIDMPMEKMMIRNGV